jgi:hypothetical protein
MAARRWIDYEQQFMERIRPTKHKLHRWKKDTKLYNISAILWVKSHSSIARFRIGVGFTRGTIVLLGEPRRLAIVVA